MSSVQINPQILADATEFIRADPEGAAEFLAEIDPISWMHHIELKTEKGEPIEFRDHKPLIGIYSDFHPDQVYQKAAQIGITETAINKILWLGDHRNLTFIYVFPTADDVYKFSQGRFNPVIKGNFYLQKRMRSSDNATQKQIANSWIYFRGAQKETQAISIPADGLVIDEFDFAPPDILDVFTKRLEASRTPLTWRFSTPTIPKYGINAWFEQTDQRHWLVKCDRCNRWQRIDFWRNVRARKGIHRFVCWKCGKLLQRRSGIWVAKYPTRATDAVYDARGYLHEPASGLRGYFVNPLAFTFITAEKKWQTWVKAEHSSRAAAIKNFYNFDLGVPYVSGESLITTDTIRNSMKPDFDVQGFNVFGCDQGDILHWVVKHISPDGTRPIVAFGVTNSFEEAYTRFVEFACRLGVIDALPNKHSARQLVQKSHKRLYMAYYKDQNEASKERIEDKKPDKPTNYSHSKQETQTLLLDRAETLDTSAKEWIDGRAYLARPRDSQAEDVQEFIEQMAAMVRDIQEDSKGIARVVWVKTGPDHYRHADNYASIAADLRTIGPITDLSVGGSIANILPQELDFGFGPMKPDDLMPRESDFGISTFKDF